MILEGFAQVAVGEIPQPDEILRRQRPIETIFVPDQLLQCGYDSAPSVLDALIGAVGQKLQ